MRAWGGAPSTVRAPTGAWPATQRTVSEGTRVSFLLGGGGGGGSVHENFLLNKQKKEENHSFKKISKKYF